MALGVILVLSALVLVFAQEMRTETQAAGNRLSAVQADAVENGAEQWAMAEIESNAPDAATIQTIPAEALQVGNGYFWLLHPDPTQTQNYGFGIVDEAGKLNLNTASSLQLQALPNSTVDISDSIADWVDTDDDTNPNGAESSYYQALTEPYGAKNSGFETVEELLMVKNMTPFVLYGYDLNHDGIIDQNEQQLGGLSAGTSTTTNDPRGMFNYLTCYSKEPNSNGNGGARVNVNSPDTSQLLQLLTQDISASRASAIVTTITPYLRRPNAFPDLGTFYTDSTMTAQEFGSVAQGLTTSAAKTLTGLVNVVTAPRQVLMCLPGLVQSDADALVSAQAGASSSGVGKLTWVFSALSASKAAGIAGNITAQSYVYSADIVAVSGDGRAFKRVRVVIDDRASPPKVVYRKDLTSLGWPLPPDVLTALRAGKPIPDTVTGTSNRGSGGGMIQ